MKKLFVGLLLVAGAALYYWFDAIQGDRPEFSLMLPVVLPHQAVMVPVTESIEALGTVRAREAVEISAKVTARVGAVNFSDNSAIGRGDVIIELDAARERAALREAEVNLQEDRRLLNHYLTLDKTQAVSRTLLEEQRAKVAASEARAAAAEAVLADFVITAPFSGVLGVRRVSPGAMVAPGTAITTLDDIAVVKVDFTVPERWAGQMLGGQAVSASSIAYPGREFVARVASIGTRIDPVTRAVMVHAELANPEGLLKPGMLLNVRLVGRERQALMITEEALLLEGSGRYVFVIGDDNVVRRVSVDTGVRQDGRVEVVSGLASGQWVVAEGTQKVRDGIAVTLATEQG
ncbi:MAG: efflux RND transporter periplasmic adaptor subunit [Porticoccaceae bacterium]